jgi:hypothetical protein
MGSLAGTEFINCTISLCDIGAGASGFGANRTPAREDGLDPADVAGRVGGFLEFWYVGPSFTTIGSLAFSDMSPMALAGELA